MIIRNPKRDINPTDKPFLSIADKKLLATQLRDQSAWSFRIYAQMIHRRDQNYNWYFVTLTYNNYFLPKFDYEVDVQKLDRYLNPYVEKYTISCPCFSREDIHKLVRGIQMDLLKKYGVTDYDYLIASEFGVDDKYTHRPHYHGVLGIPDTVTAQEVHALIKKHWAVLTGKYYRNGRPKRVPRGWILPAKYDGGPDSKGKYHKPLIISPLTLDNAAKYVSKYCCKQISYYSNTNVNKMLEALKECDNEEKLKEWKSKKPFIYASQHFGECIADWIFNKNLPSNKSIKLDPSPNVNLYEGIWTPLNRKDKTKIPFYIRRKLLFEKVEQSEIVSYKGETDLFWEDDPNSAFGYLRCEKYNCGSSKYYKKKQYQYSVQYTVFGEQFKKYEYGRKVHDKTNTLAQLFVQINSQDFENWLLPQLDNDRNEFVNICNFVKTFDPKKLAIYDTSYRDRISPLHYVDFLEDPDNYKDHTDSLPVYGWKKIRGFYGTKNVVGVIDLNFTSDHASYLVRTVNNDELAQTYSLQPPYFHGDESIQQMCCFACDFYTSTTRYISRCDDSRPFPTSISILFNRFYCFIGYDFVLSLLEDYKSKCSEDNIRAVRKRFRDKKNKTDKFFNS